MSSGKNREALGIPNRGKPPVLLDPVFYGCDQVSLLKNSSSEKTDSNLGIENVYPIQENRLQGILA
jgi:hypothetical protein